MSNHIFVSYARQDSSAVQQLEQALSARSITVWYDKEPVTGGSQWAEKVVSAIKLSDALLLILTPAAVASPHVRKEVDLAARSGKRIAAAVWQAVDIPIALEYQLAASTPINFTGVVTDENVADLIAQLQGGADDNAEADDEPKKGRLGGRKRLSSGKRQKASVSAIGVGAAVISGVVTTVDLDVDDQDFVSSELKWLFSATDNFLKVCADEVPADHPVPVPIPPDVEVDDDANNQVQLTRALDRKILQGQVESKLTQLQKHLRNLDMLLDQAANEGTTAQGNVKLQNELSTVRRNVVTVSSEIAEGMNQAYGILATSPEQLLEMLEG